MSVPPILTSPTRKQGTLRWVLRLDPLYEKCGFAPLACCFALAGCFCKQNHPASAKQQARGAKPHPRKLLRLLLLPSLRLLDEFLQRLVNDFLAGAAEPFVADNA